MRVLDTALRDVKLLSPRQYADERGWFAEIYNEKTFAGDSVARTGVPAAFVQENQSSSVRGVLRGLHYQVGHPQGKLLRVLSGHIWDVAVDLRPDSPDFGRHAAFDLQPRTAEGEIQLLWIPEGFAHGFLVLSESADVLYKTTDFYTPADERCICWNDPDLAIPWPVAGHPPIVSAKDARGSSFREAELPQAVA